MTGDSDLVKMVERLVSIARTLTERDDISAYSLMSRAGYCENFGNVTVEALLAELKRTGSQVGDWLCYSEDKRSSSGWSFSEEGQAFFVTYFGDPSREGERHEYSDPDEACAHFIKRELEEMRELG